MNDFNNLNNYSDMLRVVEIPMLFDYIRKDSCTMVNFETKTFIKNKQILIQNGKAVNGYVISDTAVTISDIEQLYEKYETSFPDKPTISIFRAKPESELKLSEIIYHENRSEAQELLAQTLLEGILNKSLIYPDNSQWFWQSEKHKNLIIPRWLFTDECHRTIAYKPQTLQENMLWSKNLVGKRLRKTLNPDATDKNIPLFKDYFLIMKEELLNHDMQQFFSDKNIQLLLKTYMLQIKNKTAKAKMGQYVTAVKNAKTPLYKTQAVTELINHGQYLNMPCSLPIWKCIYQNIIDYKTLLFITNFVPDAKPLHITTNLSDYTEQYIKDNLDAITDYVRHH